MNSACLRYQARSSFGSSPSCNVHKNICYNPGGGLVDDVIGNPGGSGIAGHAVSGNPDGSGIPGGRLVDAVSGNPGGSVIPGRSRSGSGIPGGVSGGFDMAADMA